MKCLFFSQIFGENTLFKNYSKNCNCFSINQIKKKKKEFYKKVGTHDLKLLFFVVYYHHEKKEEYLYKKGDITCLPMQK